MHQYAMPQRHFASALLDVLHHNSMFYNMLVDRNRPDETAHFNGQYAFDTKYPLVAPVHEQARTRHFQ